MMGTASQYLGDTAGGVTVQPRLSSSRERRHKPCFSHRWGNNEPVCIIASGRWVVFTKT
jgi:hypothetical protein